MNRKEISAVVSKDGKVIAIPKEMRPTVEAWKAYKKPLGYDMIKKK